MSKMPGLQISCKLHLAGAGRLHKGSSSSNNSHSLSNISNISNISNSSSSSSRKPLSQRKSLQILQPQTMQQVSADAMLCIVTRAIARLSITDEVRVMVTVGPAGLPPQHGLDKRPAMSCSVATAVHVSKFKHHSCACLIVPVRLVLTMPLVSC